MDFTEFQHTYHTLVRPAVARSQSMPLTDMRKSDETTVSEKPAADLADHSHGRLKRAKTFDPEAVLPVVPAEHTLRPPRNPPNDSILDYIPFLRGVIPRKPRSTHPAMERSRTTTGKKIRPKAADSDVPMEISLFLSSYFISLMRKELLTPASATAMNNAIIYLQDTVFNLERIKDTPLPFAYQAHLRMSLW